MPNLLNYILDENNKPVAVPSEESWKWMDEIGNRVVEQTRLDDETLISTVFLSIDHNHSGIGDPVLWETMVFFPTSEDESEWSIRYTSHEDAVRGHKAMSYLVSVRNTSMGRTLLLDWEEAWKMAYIHVELEEDNG